MIPLIGITTYSDVAQWRDWSAPAAVLPRSYVDAVRRGGGRPVLLPPGGTAAEAATTVADLDGLVVAGGGDVDPSRYGAAMHPATGAPDAERDAWELAMLDCALEAGLPLLAICRGIQFLNVVRGGTLHQHLPHVVGHEEHSGIGDDFGRHMVRIGRPAPSAGFRRTGPQRTGTLRTGPPRTGPARRVAAPPVSTGQRPMATGSRWPPTTTRPSTGSARGWWPRRGRRTGPWRRSSSPAPGPAGRGPAGFAIGVQWHPEETGDPRLFRALALAAAGHGPAARVRMVSGAAGAIRRPVRLGQYRVHQRGHVPAGR